MCIITRVQFHWGCRNLSDLIETERSGLISAWALVAFNNSVRETTLTVTAWSLGLVAKMQTNVNCRLACGMS